MAGSMGMNMPAGATEAMRNMTADDTDARRKRWEI